MLAITDTGTGMSEEVKARMFEPFVSSGKLDGTGLGLSIVKRFVDDHGGQIDVTSVPGAGTSFMVWLPKIELQVS